MVLSRVLASPERDLFGLVIPNPGLQTAGSWYTSEMLKVAQDGPRRTNVAADRRSLMPGLQAIRAAKIRGARRMLRATVPRAGAGGASTLPLTKNGKISTSKLNIRMLSSTIVVPPPMSTVSTGLTQAMMLASALVRISSSWSMESRSRVRCTASRWLMRKPSRSQLDVVSLRACSL